MDSLHPFSLFAAAVLAVTVAGNPVTVFADDEADAAIAESDAMMTNLLSPIMAKAISLYKSGKYEAALLKCEEADRIFATTKHLSSPQIAGQKNMVSQLRSDIEGVWGKKLMAPLHKDLAEAETLLEKNPAKARALLNGVIENSDKNSAKLLSLKPEAETLKTAAQKYLNEGIMAFGTRATKESKAREAFIAEKVDPLLQESNQLLDDHLYKKAYEKCLEASKVLAAAGFSDSPKSLAKKSQIIALRREISQLWERAYVLDATNKYLQAVETAPKDTKEAISLARSALSRVAEGKAELPSLSEDLVEIETACNSLIKSEEFLEVTSLENIDPSFERRKKDINELLLKGEAFYRNKMYAQARDVLEQVYILDPFNEKANVILGKIYRKINDTAWMRRENEVLERINEIEWKWTNPSRATDDELVDDTAPEDDHTSEKANLYRKLQEIEFPGTDFEEESVSDVFSQIQRRSKELDPEKKGISIVYPAFKEDKFVTLKLGNVPLGELIRYVCMYTGLKYKVNHLGVTIGESNLDDMSDRTFVMTNTLYDNITGSGAGVSEDLMSGDAPENPFEGGGAAVETGDVGGGTVSEGSEALKRFFIECGIPFAEGASVSYNKRSNKLSVRNTPENLKSLAELLEKIDVETNLVLVEAKIIEIAVSDLEELGFDWTLTHNNQDPQWLFGDASATNSVFGNSDTYKIGEAVLNQTLVRHTGGTGSAANFSTEEVGSALNLITNMNIIPNFGKDGAYNMFLTIHAVDQSSRGEVIAAPKVLAKSGQQATIQMVQQMYFPDDWEEAELEEANNTYEYTPPAPELGDETPIGTTFIVNPTVGTNLRTITMTLQPQITSLVGWTDYDYQFIIGSIQSVDSNNVTYSPKIKMPEISERSLSTQLKIYDGETVVLGGVLKENTAKRDDKYPFLGDVPLLGNLFSNKASRTNKQNLLIFVTPRLMGYNGVPVNTVTDNGRFDFNR